jgi:hypothetical protein
MQHQKQVTHHLIYWTCWNSALLVLTEKY